MTLVNMRTKYRYSNIIGLLFFTMTLLLAGTVSADSGVQPTPVALSNDLEIESASVHFISELDSLAFELLVVGKAGGMVPKAKGQLDGAPVLAYVFVTDLKPEIVGFGPVEGGILALAITVHPDFDDTPLWDENVDGNYENDGYIYHTHWVVLVSDKRVEGGLSVAQFLKDDTAVILPPTNPGMSIYLDSPGHPVNLKGNKLQVIVPGYRLKRITKFAFDAVSAYLQVNTSDNTKPMLGVYMVYDVLSGDLSLPFKVDTR